MPDEYEYVFFFSSRRRHTRFSRDWSSDVCSSDLVSPERWLTPGVGGIGVASFFSDAGHEITTAVLPSFLTATLHGSAGALGLIEGISDALTGVMKLVGGPLANDPARRGRLASGGYLGTALATGAIGLATSVWQAGALRALAWTSRGLRSPGPRQPARLAGPTSRLRPRVRAGARRRQPRRGRRAAAGRRPGRLPRHPSHHVPG